MTHTLFGRAVRFTDAIYETHLMDEGHTLWFGRSELNINILHMVARSDMRIVTELMERMEHSRRFRKSLPWR